MRPTRGSFADEPASWRATVGPGRPSPPIWPCSTRGFPCPGCRHPGGEPLPHRFTLACRTAVRGQPKVLPLAGRRGTFPIGGLVSVALSVARPFRAEPPGVTRRVALPYSNGGVRTFLQPKRLAALDQRSPAPPAEMIISAGMGGGKLYATKSEYSLIPRARRIAVATVQLPKIIHHSAQREQGDSG
jgi:hypothetical protein